MSIRARLACRARSASLTLADRRGPGFDRTDLAADLIGATAAGLVTRAWEKP